MNTTTQYQLIQSDTPKRWHVYEEATGRYFAYFTWSAALAFIRQWWVA